MEYLKEYAWETDESELNELMNFGYEVIYCDVSLSVIYEEITNCFEDHEVTQRIKEHFGYYGLCELIQVDGVYYWLMQV